MAIVVILSQNNTVSTTLTLYDAEDLAAAGTPNNAKFSYFTTREKKVLPRCVYTSDWRHNTYNSTYFVGFTLQLTLAHFNDFTKRRMGINFSICFNSHSVCVQRQTLEIFSTDSLFFLLLHKCTTTLFLDGLCWSGTEPWNVSKFPPQNTCLFFVSPQNRPRNRFSVLATTRNFPQEHGPTTVLLEEEGLLWNTFLQTAKDLLLSQSHLRGTSKICFLPGHNFCWNWWPAKEGNWTFSIVE